MARVHITGASGAGVSTLGRALAEVLGVPWHDTDDFFWLPTEPPYQEARPPEFRLALLEPVLAAEGWVLSGSLDGWGDGLVPRFELVVFVQTPMPLRLERLRRRERGRYGAAIDPGGAMHEAHEAFLAWAAAYDHGGEAGRNLPRHLAWLERLPCPVLRLDGSLPVLSLVDTVLRSLRRR